MLLGVIALQVDFIDRDTLVDAMQRWIQAKHRSLVEILREQGQLNERQAELLENLAKEHVHRHGGTAADGLAALSSIDSVRTILQQIDDPDVGDSLANLSPDRQDPETYDPATTFLPEFAGQPIDDARNRFRILRTHARGGLGQVSLAEDEALHRHVALKEIIDRYADQPGSRERFLVEAEITGRLQHPGIVPVYGLGTYPDGRPFYAMRFIEGDNLLMAIRRFHHQAENHPWQGELLVAFRELLGRFMDVCDAMQFAHQRHVLHRDLKPHNIMLGEFGETLVVDWGLAKPLYEGVSKSQTPEEAIVPMSGSASGKEYEGSILGTLDYMPPEQASGNLSQLSCRSDIYSLGATLYHLLTNSPPFEIREELSRKASIDSGLDKQLALFGKLERVRSGEFPAPRKVNARVPRGLNAICLRAMATDPDQRYASARELKQEIQRWLADEPVQAVPEAWYDKAARWFRHHRTVAFVAGSSLLVLAVLASLSTVLINHYRLGQLREAGINQISTELEGTVDRMVAANAAMDKEFFDTEFDPLLDQLKVIAPERAARREKVALEAAADDIQRRLTESAPTEDKLAALAVQVDDWAERRAIGFNAESLQAREQELRELLKNRQAPWNQLEELAGETLIRGLERGEDLMVDNEGLVKAQADASRYAFHALTLSQLPANLNHQLSVTFDEASLGGPAVAVCISPQDARPEITHYQAVMCVEGFAAGQWSPVRLRRLPSLSEAIHRGDAVRLLLCRGRTVLNEIRVHISPREFSLSIRRDDDRLRGTLSQADSVPTQIEYHDFLPLAHGNRPAIWIGPTTRIQSVQVGFRTRPMERTELEEIKILVSNGQLDEALEKLTQRPDRFSKFLRSRCLTQPGDRLLVLDELLGQAPQINANGVVLDDWYLPALLDAIELNDENPERFRELVYKLLFYYGTSIEDIAVRIPLDMRQRLLSEFRKLGGRWRVATQPTGDSQMLDTAVRLDKVLEPNAVMRRATRWRRCDVWRVSDRTDEAERELRDLLAEALDDPAAEPAEAAYLLSDLCWLLFSRQRLAETEAVLGTFDGRTSLPEYMPATIQVETARLAAHQNRFDAAAEVLAELLNGSVPIRQVQHADACLLAGFVESERGNMEAAEAYWQRGRTFQGQRPKLRNPEATRVHGSRMVEHQFRITIDGTLGSLVNGFTEEEAQAGFDAHVPEAGVYGASGRAIVKMAFDKTLVRDLANALYRSPHGQQTAKQMAYRSVGFRDFFCEPIKLMIFEGVVLNGFRDYRSDTELMADVLASCGEIFKTYDAGGINEQEDMRLIVMLWSGQADMDTWRALAPKLSQDVAAGLALVAGRAQMLAAENTDVELEKKSHLQRAQIMLETARDSLGATAAFKRLAETLLREIE